MSLRALAAIIRQYPHPKRICNSANSSADISKANNANGFSCQLYLRRLPEAEIRACAPLSTVYRVAVMLHTVTKRQQEGKGELCNGICAIVGHIADENTSFFGCSAVNNIIAGCQHAN